MRTIELAGPIGSGKTVIADALTTLLSRPGCPAYRLDDVPDGRTRGLIAIAVFSLRHADLSWMAARALLAAPIPWWHRRRILRLVLILGARLERAERRVPPGTWVVVEEGWAQRAVNLFAWRAAPIPELEIRRWLRRTPIRGPVVIVEAPAGVARERAERRGLPKRLRGADEAGTAHFLDNARQITELAAAQLTSQGERVIHINNSGSVEAAAASVAQDLNALVPQDMRLDAVAFRPRVPISLPRPDRVMLRWVARRPTSEVAEVTAAVLARYGLPPRTPIRRVGSTWSRGASLRVDAPEGRLLLKRYKASIEPDQLRGEHSILGALARCGIAAPRLHPAADGETWVEVAGGRYAAFAYLDGYVHPHDRVFWPGDRSSLQTLSGEALADLHAALEGFVPAAASPMGFAGLDGERLRPCSWYVKRLERAASVLGPAEIARDDSAWVAVELPRLEAMLDSRGLQRTVIHGDFGPYNVLVRAGRRLVIIDFELARLDWRLTDLATGLPRFAHGHLGFDVRVAERLLAGYRRRHPLPDDELASLPELAALLHLRRVAVCWARMADGVRGPWGTEVTRRLRHARALISGHHPLVQVARP